MGVNVSVILPCRDEERTLAGCIRQIKKSLDRERLDYEIIVSDSSTDSSPEIAKRHGVKLVRHNKKGYGIAIIEAMHKAKGTYIVIGDADGTYDFSEIPLLIEQLDYGHDLVIGSRLKGNIKKGAMPWHHKYIGNPLLSFLLNVFFRTKVSDAHSGFRAIRKDYLFFLNLKTTGMEFASEMIIKAAKNNLDITEVPITYSPRIGESKLKSFSDGWRHLRFMLMFSPTYLFFIPGLLLLLSGFFILGAMMAGTLFISGQDVSIYMSLLGSSFSVLGYQLMNLGLYSKIYAIHTGFEKEDKLIDFIAKKVPLERGIILGLGLVVLGLAGFFLFFQRLFTTLNTAWILFILSVFIIGVQTVFSVFFISMMLVEKRD
ncbi:TPA: glycosyltransferase family 2 protein [Candidatus Woesearchaeota archaeon]|nr:Dolichol phosphate mannosyltransferase or dolichol phosphate beta glucosyltrandferase [archaeon GW2011_AR15]HIH41184.1 glycosyltransferase family 2 protein [Candidatus Woesearchaeota archaeon]